MSRGSYPLLMTLALSGPGAVHALGLGDIHVDSKLNEPLSAQIDIVGASESELGALRASIAGREQFQQAGADLPAFLSTAHFDVIKDGQGRAVIRVRSTSAFTEPVVNLLIELRWPNGRLVRDYTLLLDPPGLGGQSALAANATAQPVATPATTPAAAASAASSMQAAEHPDAPAAQSSSSSVPLAGAIHRVRPHETLHGIARQAGARSAADVRRMMIALFRINQEAFDANINRLHRGASLRLPTNEQLAGLSKAEVNREYSAHMSSWRLAGRTASSIQAPAPQASAPATAVAAARPETELEQRIQKLENTLAAINGEMARGESQLQQLQRQADTVEAPPVEPAPIAAQSQDTLPTQGKNKRPALAAGIMAALSVPLLFLWARRRRPVPAANAQVVVQEPASAVAETPEPIAVATPAPIAASQPASIKKTFDEDADEETIILNTASADTISNRLLDTTLAIPEDTAQHVYMSGELNSTAHAPPFVERRKSVIDVLSAAVEREPHRRELKLKLLELHFSAAIASQAAFLDLARKLANDRDMLASGDWERVAAMGRAIAPNERLFLPDAPPEVAQSDSEQSAA